MFRLYLRPPGKYINKRTDRRFESKSRRFYVENMADTAENPNEAPVEAAPAPAPAAAPAEDEPTPGADVNTGPSENLREVSVRRGTP